MTSTVPGVAAAGYPDDFYGFPEVPFHVHLGMRFDRLGPNGPAVVTLPSQPHLVEPDGRHSVAAVYTVGEVASGIAICDALALSRPDSEAKLMPLVLTRKAVFKPAFRPRGDIRSRAEALGDVPAAAERLRVRRKVNIEVRCTLRDDGDDVAGMLHVYFYVRMMELGRLEAMAGEMMPAMAERAREVLGQRTAGG
ncbi:MAG TPA: hypothetical protein VF093_05400 [Solirubrobacterales bacterium]